MTALFDIAKSPVTGRMLIEASAGTGKTYSLEHIAARLVVEEGCEISRILVVTFGRAATAELKERIRALLTRLRDSVRYAKSGQASGIALDGAEQEITSAWTSAGINIEERLSEAVGGFDDAGIFTIHGFCQKMLSEFSFTCGGDPDINIGDTSPLNSAVVDAFLRESLPQLSPEDGISLMEWKLGKLLKKLVLCPPGQVPDVVFTSEEIEKARKREIESDGPNSALAAAILRFAAEAPGRLARAKADAGTLDHDDTLAGMMRLVSSNPAFVRRVRGRYGAVLIDEFQDTDPVQYGIFRKLFLENDGGGELPGTVIFVGDPKQSIYGFRRSDLDTYIRARTDIGNTLELGTNFRSAPALVSAVTGYFSNQEAGRAERKSHFLNKGIGFSAIASSPAKLPLLENTGGVLTPLPSFSAWLTPAVRDAGFFEMNSIKETEAEWIAADIASTLSREVYIRRSGEFRRVQAGDIAILVRKHRQAEPLIRKLRARGIRCQHESNEDVYASAEALEILAVVRALAAPGDRRLTATARGTPLFGRSLAEIRESGELLVEDSALLHECLKLWEKSGPASALNRLMTARDTAGRILMQRGGGRKMTNYQHIIGLLQARQDAYRTPAAAAGRFETAISSKGEAPDERNLRSESDDNVVCIQTIHKSKGLEYPVVYIAGLFEVKADDKDFVTVERHPGQGERFLFTKKELSASKHAAAGRRSLEESVRLAYVAMTRASCRVVLPLFLAQKDTGKYWMKYTFRHAFTFALLDCEKPDHDSDTPYTTGIDDYLARLHEIRDELAPLAPSFAGAIRSNADPAACGGASGFCPDLDDVGHYFEIVRSPPPAPAQVPPAVIPAFSAAPAVTVRQSWKQSSFTSISRDFGRADTGSEEYEGDEPRPDPRDEDPPVESPAADDAPEEAPGIFPCGAEAGDWLHRRLERCISTNSLPEGDSLARQLARAPFLSGRSEDEIRGFAGKARDMLAAALTCPLCREPGGPVTVMDTPPEMRSAEMQFLLPVRNRSLTPGLLAERLSRCGFTFSSEEASSLFGFLTGSIDLMILAGGKYWVIDWKSNRIGTGEASCYTEKAVEAEIGKHNYALQYIVYLTALRRHLMDCLGIGAEEAWQRIGGALYVFLRGLDPGGPDPESGPRHGVFLARPKKAVDVLDALLEGRDAEDLP